MIKRRKRSLSLFRRFIYWTLAWIITSLVFFSFVTMWPSQYRRFPTPKFRSVSPRSQDSCHSSCYCCFWIAGSAYLVWNLFEGTTAKTPYSSILFYFEEFTHFIYLLMDDVDYYPSHQRTSRDYDGATSKILLVNLKEAIANSALLIADTLECAKGQWTFLKSAVDDYLKNIIHLENYRWDPDDCIIQDVYRPDRIQ